MAKKKKKKSSAKSKGEPPKPKFSLPNITLPDTRTLLLGLVLLAVLLGAALPGVAWLYNRQTPLAEEFFSALCEGRLGRVINTMHPSLAGQIDPPVLGMYADFLAEKLGPLESVRVVTQIRRKDHYSYLQSRGSARFVGGVAELTLTACDGQVTSFSLTHPAVMDFPVYSQPRSDFYRAKAAQLVSLMLLDRPAQARAKMSFPLRQRWPAEKIKAVSETTLRRLGTLEEVRPLEQEFRDHSKRPELIVMVEVRGSEARQVVPVRYVFTGWRAELVDVLLIDPARQ
jgi:hypothetical protein